MRRFSCLFLILLVVGAAAGGALIYLRDDEEPQVAGRQSVDQDEPAPQFELLILQTNGDQRRISRCQAGRCQEMPSVESAAHAAAVTDGVSWYHYQEEETARNNSAKRLLVRTWIDTGQTDKLVEQTPLVEPRGLYISPDNQKVAYWLDNIDEPDEELTELWVYDASEGGTKVLAEKIHRPGVRTDLRWNRSSNNLWFVGETASQPGQQSEAVHVISIHRPGIELPFINRRSIPVDIAASGPMDINTTGDTLAYARHTLFNRSAITTIGIKQPPQVQTVRGDVPFMQWLEDDSLLYATQDNHSFTFWQMRNNIHQHVAKINGTLISARGDSQGRHLMFAARLSNSATRASVLDTGTGSVTEQGTLPPFGNTLHILQFEPLADLANESITSRLDDNQLTAFIEKHIESIANEEAQPQRLIITEKQNTVFIDYLTPTGDKRRTLATIRDAIHPEWSVSARYREENGEWVKTQGVGFTDPTPARLYEWEEQVQQWILKEEFEE